MVLRLYMKEETPWGTMRIDYDNQYVQDFVIASCLHFLQRYRVDGFRIDNVDGILRYGDAGEGDERPNGRRFLRRLHKTLFAYHPHSLIHLESHYFFEDNAKMLVVPFALDNRSLGATAYNSSRLTHYFHTQYMPKSADEISAWRFRDIAEEKEWGQSNSTIADFHNHDAAAGLMAMRCTGSYAYDAMTVKQPHNHYHAIGKIKTMEAIIAFCCEGRTLDLAQTFLLQRGTFEHDSSIRWYLAFNECNRALMAYKQKINELMDAPAFWPQFVHTRQFLNVDDTSKVIVIERSDDKDVYVIVINLTSWVHYDYRIGVRSGKDYTVVFNSDAFAYAGSGTVSYQEKLPVTKSTHFEVLDKEFVLPVLAPYGIVVLKKN